MNTPLPVIFVSHGSPMVAINGEKTGSLLSDLGTKLPKSKIKAVLVVSAHWLSLSQPSITASVDLETIHDFGGFPRSLYEMQYQAKGSPVVAKHIQALLNNQGYQAELDFDRGLDHGAWIPLQFMFPQAEIPILQLSLPWPMDGTQAVKFGKALKPLREEGILVITSGSLTHNLYDIGEINGQPKEYIQPFVNWINQVLDDYDLDKMANYRQLAPHAKQAHPTEEHFLPLAVAMAASSKDDKVTKLDGGVSYQALAMIHDIFGNEFE